MSESRRWPSYLQLTLAELRARRDHALAELASCTLCPRACRADRSGQPHPAGAHLVEPGVEPVIEPICMIGRQARVSSWFAHHGEEDCLRGSRGSGTIFFAGCNLRCVFCQNWDISQAQSGERVDAQRLAEIMLLLQEQGCHNINFVTPEHVVAQLLEALPVAVEGGLRLPIVYNTSAYDAPGSLRLLDGIVDIYLPDFKFWDAESAKRLLKAPDYRDVACHALRAMHGQVGSLQLDGSTGLATRGVLVRHLVMPGHTDDAGHIMRFLHDELGSDTFVNIMGQYRPLHRVPGNRRYRDIGRRPSHGELEAVYACARGIGLTRFA